MTPFNITLELFEKYQPIVDYIKDNEKVLENLKNAQVNTNYLTLRRLTKTVVGKKSDAHDNKVPTHFARRLKKG